MSLKRERSINFTREEVDILINLVGDNKHVLENKKSDSVTWSEKERCWKAIETSFNSASGVTYRTSKNLRLKYEGIKRETRKKSALIRAETYRTGGGPSTAPALTSSEVKIKDMILLSVDGMESNFDSDHVKNAVVSECSTSPHCSMANSTGNPDEIIPWPSVESEGIQCITSNILKESPVRPIKRTLFNSPLENELGEGDCSAETGKKWSQWKPASLRSKKHPALCKSKSKRPFEKVADAKIEIAELQKKILEEELANKRLKWSFEENEREQHQKRWAFEEEERQHRREIWALEIKVMKKKLNED